MKDLVCQEDFGHHFFNVDAERSEETVVRIEVELVREHDIIIA